MAFKRRKLFYIHLSWFKLYIVGCLLFFSTASISWSCINHCNAAIVFWKSRSSWNGWVQHKLNEKNYKFYSNCQSDTLIICDCTIFAHYIYIYIYIYIPNTKVQILELLSIETMQVSWFNKGTALNLTKVIETNLTLSTMDGVHFFCNWTKLGYLLTIDICYS